MRYQLPWPIVEMVVALTGNGLTLVMTPTNPPLLTPLKDLPGVTADPGWRPHVFAKRRAVTIISARPTPGLGVARI